VQWPQLDVPSAIQTEEAREAYAVTQWFVILQVGHRMGMNCGKVELWTSLVADRGFADYRNNPPVAPLRPRQTPGRAAWTH
jgi:hypothetical protein